MTSLHFFSTPFVFPAKETLLLSQIPKWKQFSRERRLLMPSSDPPLPLLWRRTIPLCISAQVASEKETRRLKHPSSKKIEGEVSRVESLHKNSLPPLTVKFIGRIPPPGQHFGENSPLQRTQKKGGPFPQAFPSTPISSPLYR